ncbi:SH3 domain-containing C40 family peptidase [Aquabacterium sp.]|uniref:SH3 domain-containing C40 family peptidase n=1 Tax=Aquabacterium sp. TaxID=1872578 RepID=UPI002BB104B5|nr:DUF2272 domain-containing protein [Aquabacterium sp.]HSW07133.1 DUF2272 domain-containing protein [Aquabacterium sp.]
METFTVPCTRCDEFRARFEAEGFTVQGCDPDPNKADMCVLKFERPTTIKAAAAAPIGATAASAPAGAAAKTTKSTAKASSGTAAAAPAAPAVPTALAARRHVNLKALNLRSTPSASSSANVLRTLSLGQPVELIGDQQSGWWPVQVPDGSERGFVKALIDDSNGIGTPSLRVPVEAARESLVAEAVRQWERFKFGQGKETVDPFFKMIGEMWAAIKLPHDGRDDIPWSAAAISFMVRQAAASHAGYKPFKFAASHSKYIHDAIIKAGQAGAPFHGFRLFEHKPQLGDLVARSREGAISFEQAAASDAFKSHTDVIVAIHADAVYAIGGNVSDSVSVTRYPKTDSGHLSDAGGVFALLVNKV